MRAVAFERWLASLPSGLGLDAASLRAASADASFRRYLRIDSALGPRIVMDAPPSHEDCRPFVRMSACLRRGGLNAPEVLAFDEAGGFMLLGDLGSMTLLEAVVGRDDAYAMPFYMEAIDTLVRLQGIEVPDELPLYDRALMRRELDLFAHWYVEVHCGVRLSPDEHAMLERSFGLVLDACQAQPQVLVHRDYHSRNLMVSPGPGGLGVLDFQDAVRGPVTYDLVSLLRDAYTEWDEATQIDWAVRFWQGARAAKLPVDADFGVFWRDFEWMGLQRHLKVLGIFARLSHRDGKDGYLSDLPRVWRYAHHVAMRYRSLGPLGMLLERLAGVQRVSGTSF